MSIKDTLQEETKELRSGFLRRLRGVMAELGIKTQAELGERVGSPQPVVQKWLTGKTFPSPENLLILSRMSGKTIDWLLTGKDTLARPIVPPPTLEIHYPPRLKIHDSKFSLRSYIPIRLLKDPVAGRDPMEVTESDTEGWVLTYASRDWVPNDPEHYTCARIHGRSMYPILNDGDIVAIDHLAKNPHDLDKSIAAFRVDGGVTVKWLKFFPEKALVVGVPENKDEFDTVVTLKAKEIDSGIIGRVAWWWAKRSTGNNA